MERIEMDITFCSKCKSIHVTTYACGNKLRKDQMDKRNLHIKVAVLSALTDIPDDLILEDIFVFSYGYCRKKHIITIEEVKSWLDKFVLMGLISYNETSKEYSLNTD